MFTVERLEISDEERAELERRVRAHTSAQRVARRARVILLCADGCLSPDRRESTWTSTRSAYGGDGSSTTASTV